MKYLGIYFVFVFLWTICSCRPGEEGRKMIRLQEEEKSPSEVFLSSLVKDYSVIPLQTGEAGAIGDIQKILGKEGRFFVVADGKRVHAFDEGGKQLYVIDRLGRGGGQEYQMIKDVDLYKDHLVIMDYRRLLFYDQEGNYLYEVPFDFKAVNFKIVSDHRIVFYTSEDDYVIYITDEKGKPEKKYLAKTQGLRLHRTSPFIEWQGNILVQKGHSNEFWKYDPERDQEENVFLIDQEKTLSAFEEENLLKEYGNNYGSYASDYLMPDGLVTGGGQYLVAWMYKEDIHFCTGETESGKNRTYPLRKVKDDISFTNASFLGFTSVCREEDGFLSFLWPFQVRQGLARFEQNNPDRLQEKGYLKMKALLDSFPDLEEANPFIIKYKFMLP